MNIPDGYVLIPRELYQWLLQKREPEAPGPWDISTYSISLDNNQRTVSWSTPVSEWSAEE